MMLECGTCLRHSPAPMTAGVGSQPLMLECRICPVDSSLVTVGVACQWMLECGTGLACAPLVRYAAVERKVMVLACWT